MGWHSCKCNYSFTKKVSPKKSYFCEVFSAVSGGAVVFDCIIDICMKRSRAHRKNEVILSIDGLFSVLV